MKGIIIPLKCDKICSCSEYADRHYKKNHVVDIVGFEGKLLRVCRAEEDSYEKPEPYDYTVEIYVPAEDRDISRRIYGQIPKHRKADNGVPLYRIKKKQKEVIRHFRHLRSLPDL